MIRVTRIIRMKRGIKLNNIKKWSLPVMLMLVFAFGCAHNVSEGILHYDLDQTTKDIQTWAETKSGTNGIYLGKTNDNRVYVYGNYRNAVNDVNYGVSEVNINSTKTKMSIEAIPQPADAGSEKIYVIKSISRKVKNIQVQAEMISVSAIERISETSYKE